MSQIIYVEATHRIIGSIKGAELVKRVTEVIPVDVSKFVWGGPRAVFFAQLETSLRIALQARFVQRLKTETATKRMVGGTKWTVDLVGSVDEFPLYTSQAQVGDFMQFINTKYERWGDRKKVYDLVGQIVHRNEAIIEQLVERNKPASNDGDVTLQA